MPGHGLRAERDRDRDLDRRRRVLAQRRRAPLDRLHHEADDRAAHARAREARRTPSPPPATSRRRPSRRSGCEPGERMSVRDLMRGLLVESANDAAVTLAEGVSGSAPRVRARDEPPRAAAQAAPTRTTRTRSGSTSAATTRAPATSSGSPSLLRDEHASSAPRSTGRASGSTSGNRDAHLRQPQRPGRPLPAGSTASRAATPARRATCSSARGATHAASSSSPPCSAPRASRARDDGDAGAAALAAAGASSGSPRSSAAPSSTRVPIRYRRGAELALVARRSVRRVVPRGQRDDVTLRVVGRARRRHGPDRRRAVVRHASRSSTERPRRRAACRWSRPRASPPPTSSRRRSPGSPARCRSCSRSPSLAGTVLVGRQLRRTLRDGRRAGEEARAA